MSCFLDKILRFTRYFTVIPSVYLVQVQQEFTTQVKTQTRLCVFLAEVKVCMGPAPTCL
jgi:hypothetical protein